MRHLRGNVVAYAALFLALGLGTAYAIERNSVESKHIAPGAVKGSDIADGAVDSSELGSSAIRFSENQTIVEVPDDGTANDGVVTSRSGSVACAKEPGDGDWVPVTGGLFWGDNALNDVARYTVDSQPGDFLTWQARGANDTGETQSFAVFVICIED